MSRSRPMTQIRTSRVVAASAAWIALTGAASAGTLPEELEAAKTALASSDTGSADSALDAALDAATQLEATAEAAQLARIHYYRGLMHHIDGKTEDAMQAWRHALLIDNDFTWDEALLADGPTQDLFEALRREVRSYPEAQSQVPFKVGTAQLFLDGRRVCPGDKVPEGMHLTQVDCPDDRIHGDWTTFPAKKVKWLKLCPQGVDVDAAPVVEEAGDDDPFGFGDMVGESDSCPEIDEATYASLTAPPGGAGVGGGAPAGGPPLVRRSVSWPMVAAGGGLLVGGGVALAIAQSRKSTFLDPSTSYSTLADVDTAAKKVNSAAWAGTTMTVLGGGLCVAAVIPW